MERARLKAIITLKATSSTNDQTSGWSCKRWPREDMEAADIKNRNERIAILATCNELTNGIAVHDLREGRVRQTGRG